MKYVQFNSSGEIVAFYDDAINTPAQIAAGTPITDAQWETFADSPESWQTLATSLLAVPPVPPEVRLAAIKTAVLVEVRSLRAQLFPTLAGLQSEALARGNTADALAIAGVQQGARDITLTDLSACTTKAEVDAAFVGAWNTIVATAPASVILAFKGLKK